MLIPFYFMKVIVKKGGKKNKNKVKPVWFGVEQNNIGTYTHGGQAY